MNELTNKPDWKDAPEAANYLAMDGDGTWCWFETEPSWEDSIDGWTNPYDGRVWAAGYACQYPEDSLEKRP